MSFTYSDLLLLASDDTSKCFLSHRMPESEKKEANRAFDLHLLVLAAQIGQNKGERKAHHIEFVTCLQGKIELGRRRS